VALISNNPAPEDLAEDSEVQPSPEERRALIERVARSEQLSRSARLRDFLLYVGRQSLKDGSPEIHEQEIGHKVFGRPTSYDRSQDNIVRVNATELRKRIELYFATAGAHEPLILDIPRGSYKPVFRRRLPQAQDQTAPSPEEFSPAASTPHEADAGVRSHPGYHWHLSWAVACLLLAIACTVLFQQNRSMRRAILPWEGKPAVGAFWEDFLRNNQQTDIVLPDDSASVIEDITHRPVALQDYLSHEYLRRIQSADISADRKEDLYQILNHNLVTFGAVRAAQRIIGEIPAPHSQYLTFARYYTGDEIKRNNVVLIGGKKAVPWDHLFDDKVNFVTDYDDLHSQPFVRNINPKSGEQAIYAVSFEPNSLVGYSTIAYLPNPSQTGNAIILAGTDSDATNAAAEFLTSEEQMEKFRAALHTSRFPYFEVLLKTTRLSGTPFSAELLAYRTYPGLH
jgi:hypothetical protein